MSDGVIVRYCHAGVSRAAPTHPAGECNGSCSRLSRGVLQVLERVNKAAQAVKQVTVAPSTGSSADTGVGLSASMDAWLETASDDSDSLIMGQEFGLEEFGYEVCRCLE